MVHLKNVLSRIFSIHICNAPIVLIIAIMFLCPHIFAATISSTASGGDWNSGSSWVGGSVPQNSDDVIIVSGAVIVMDASVTRSSSTMTTINSGGTLSFIDTTILAGQGSFTLSSGATLKIGSPDGITASAASGNIQVTGTRSYSTDATYEYSSASAQVTGDGLPAAVHDLTINTMATVTLTSTTSLAGNLTINGVFDLNDHDFSVSDSVYNNGTLRAWGGESVTLGKGNDCSSGTVHFYGTGARYTLGAGWRNGANPVRFYNVIFSGTGAVYALPACSTYVAATLACTTSACTLQMTGGTGHAWNTTYFDGKTSGKVALVSSNTDAWRLYCAKQVNDKAMYVYASRSNASGGIAMAADTNSVDGGGNFNWDFNYDRMVIRSIGIRTSAVFAGTGIAGTNTAGDTVFLESGAFPDSCGEGDSIRIGTTSGFIRRRVDATHLKLQVAVTGGLSDQDIGIFRAFNNLQAWENARQGNLVTANRIEKGVCYNDGAFTAGLTIDGSTTDAGHYMWLTVAENQRHNGTSHGGGVVVNMSSTVGHVIVVRDDYTKVEWLRITDWDSDKDNECFACYADAAGVLFNGIIAHSAEVGNNSGYPCGIGDAGNGGMSVRNCIVYNLEGHDKTTGFVYGIKASQNSTLYNCTVYHISNAHPQGSAYGIGVAAGSGQTIARNCIAIGADNGDFYENGGTFDAVNSANNLSGDNTAAGSSPLINKRGEDQFSQKNGAAIDLHLRNGADAINAGDSAGLSAGYLNDIDGAIRQGYGVWDIGADEYTCARTRISLANGALGQEISAFTYHGTETNAELFAFCLAPAASQADSIRQLVFSLNNINGLADGDWSGIEILVDQNGNGAIDGGELTAVGGAGAVNTAAMTITFAEGFTLSDTTNYIMRADFSNTLDAGDRVTISLYASNITCNADTILGACDSVTHWEVPWYNPGRPLFKQYTAVSGNQIFVQNLGPGATTTSYFSSARDSLQQFYMEFNASTGVEDGLLNSFKAASSDPGAQVSAAFELLPSADRERHTLFNIMRKRNASDSSYYARDADAISFTVAESTTARTVYRINQRAITLSGNNASVVSQFTVYPTGHIFIYDSSYVTGDDDTMQVWFNQARNTNEGAVYANVTYGGLYGSGAGADNLLDFVAGYVGYRDKDGGTVAPYNNAFTINPGAIYKGIGLRGSMAGFNSGKAPYQQAFMVDFSQDNVSAAVLDDFMQDKQSPHVFDDYDFKKGWYVKTKKGDLNNDGFNESEGAYELYCLGDQVYFMFNYHLNKRMRYYPVFRMNNYTSSTMPTVVYLQHPVSLSVVDTLTPGAGEVNISLDDLNNFVVFQINRVIRDSVLIFCGDPTSSLAVTMGGFWGDGENGESRLRWRTESEKDNLGFNLYRRDVTAAGKKPVIDRGHSHSLPGPPYNDHGNGHGPKSYNLITDYTVLKGKLTHALRTEYAYCDKSVELGHTYEYQIESVDISRTAQAYNKTVIVTIDNTFPFTLEQNAPNPFNPSTMIRYTVPGKFSSKNTLPVRLEIFNIRGQLVKNLVCADQRPNQYDITWNGKANSGRYVSSGVYYYRIAIGSHHQAFKTMIVIK